MNFDLNINNYKKNELKEMFDLPNNYDQNIIDINATKLKESIFSNREINQDLRNKTIYFLTEAKKILLEDIYQKVENAKEITEEKVKDYFNSIYDLKPVDIEDNNEHMIQSRKNQPYLSSFPSEFFPGTINPIKKRINNENLNIDTRFRDNYYNSSSSNFNLTLPTNFNDVIELQLTSIQLPHCYYAISKQYDNNFFNITITETDGGLSKTAVITIPDGNYDQFSVIAAINTSLIVSGNPFNLITFNIDLASGLVSGSLVGSGQTLVGQITLNTVFSYELNFQADKFGIGDENTPLPLKLGWMLGFRNGIYVNNLNYVSEGIVDVSGPKYIYLVLDDFNNKIFKSNGKCVKYKPILTKCSMNAKTVTFE